MIWAVIWVLYRGHGTYRMYERVRSVSRTLQGSESEHWQKLESARASGMLNLLALDDRSILLSCTEYPVVVQL